MRRACVAFLPLVLLVTASAFAVTTPVILNVSPDTVVAGSGSFTLTVNGANFESGAAIRFNNVAIGTTRVSDSKLTATIASGSILNAGTANITTTNPGSAPSSSVQLT